MSLIKKLVNVLKPKVQVIITLHHSRYPNEPDFHGIWGVNDKGTVFKILPGFVVINQPKYLTEKQRKLIFNEYDELNTKWLKEGVEY